MCVRFSLFFWVDCVYPNGSSLSLVKRRLRRLLYREILDIDPLAKIRDLQRLTLRLKFLLRRHGADDRAGACIQQIEPRQGKMTRKSKIAEGLEPIPGSLIRDTRKCGYRNFLVFLKKSSFGSKSTCFPEYAETNLRRVASVWRAIISASMSASVS